MAQRQSDIPLVIACMENHPKAVMLLRTAQRKAHELNGMWRAVFVETPSQMVNIADPESERSLQLLTLAAQMGGEVAQLEAETREKGFKQQFEEEKDRLKLCVVGTTEPETWLQYWWQRHFGKNLSDLAALYAPVEQVVFRNGSEMSRAKWMHAALPGFKATHLLYALIAICVAYGGAALLQWLLPPALFRLNTQNVALLFMIAVAFVSSRYGLLPGLLSSVAGGLMANYYFFPPYQAIRVINVTDALNMALFMGAAIFISVFTSQTRRYGERAARRELGTQALFTLYRIAANAFTRQEALEQLHRELTRMLHMEVVFFLPPALNPDTVIPVYPEDCYLDDEEQKALEVCWKQMKSTGFASPYNPGTEWRFEPMLAPGGEVGVLAVRPYSGQKLDAWYGKLLSAIADQTAAVLEHIELERSMEATRIREEREKLRSMLLSSVSHDLKTPLAGIIGALSVYQSLGERLPAARRADLMETALEEAHRLDSFITNILDMTRLESGKIDFHQDWQPLEPLIQTVIKRLQHRLRKHTLVVQPVPEGLEVYVDLMMTEQVLQNLLDNACKYTKDGSAIELSVLMNKDGCKIQVRDHGEGLPEDKITKIFDKYARVQKKDMQIAGTGLGLAICRAIMQAQGGLITAANHPQGGAIFTVSIPQWRLRQRTIPVLAVHEQPGKQAASS